MIYVGWGRHYTYLSSIDQTLRLAFFFINSFIDISLDKKLPLNVRMVCLHTGTIYIVLFLYTEVLLFNDKIIGWDINYQHLGVVNKKNFSLNFSIRKQFQLDYRVARAESIVSNYRVYAVSLIIFLCKYYKSDLYTWNKWRIFKFNLWKKEVELILVCIKYLIDGKKF